VKHYHKNPRTLTSQASKKLRETMKEFGDLSGIIHNIETDEIIGGNQRTEVGDLLNKRPVILEKFEKPLADGTVALGYLDYNGRRFNYRAVKWDEAKAEKANIIANMSSGKWDWDMLANSFSSELLVDLGFDGEFLHSLNMDALNLRESITSLQKDISFEDLYDGLPDDWKKEKGLLVQVIVHFRSEKDLQKFGKLIGYQDLTKDRKSIWFPKKEEEK
jgi:hypothetical protein